MYFSENLLYRCFMAESVRKRKALLFFREKIEEY